MIVTALLGLEQRGFTAVELQLMGPGLVGCGVLLVLLRVCLLTLHPGDKKLEQLEFLFIKTNSTVVESTHDYEHKEVGKKHLEDLKLAENTNTVKGVDNPEHPRQEVPGLTRPQLTTCWRRN